MGLIIIDKFVGNAVSGKIDIYLGEQFTWEKRVNQLDLASTIAILFQLEIPSAR